ncbi:Hypothetical predicted protein [Marmota monax]|uniref:Uncharacterized protein n=1 Tax=Marmota monax TaxID=9995 RepID=A0A5E4BE71_MARMO|nr:hypothetical protein GHT09_009655 [Marmota monax]VTJ67645.1 Hypothetical predicted protein [Marmota monax]
MPESLAHGIHSTDRGPQGTRGHNPGDKQVQAYKGSAASSRLIHQWLLPPCLPVAALASV